jgi:hypothetical protein
MSKSKTEKGRKQSDAKRKAADDNPPSDRRAKKKLADQPGVGQKGHQAAAGQSEEALFKIKYAAEFDNESDREDTGGQIQVKREPRSGDLPAAAYGQPAVESIASTPDETLTLPAVETPRRATATQDGVDQEDVLVAILSQASWDSKMTEMTVKALSERAKERTAGGHLFDTGYLDKLFARLDGAGINAERRSEVVVLLQKAFTDVLSHWSTCVGQIGNEGPSSRLPGSPFQRTRRSSPMTTPSHPILLDTDEAPELVDVELLVEAQTPQTVVRMSTMEIRTRIILPEPTMMIFL